MNMTDMLIHLSSAAGVAGREGAAVSLASGLLAPYGETSVMPLGNLLCRIKPAREGRPNILLDAHIDEIGIVVTAIEDGGFLKVAPRGGIDRALLPGSRVHVHTAAGTLLGVISSIPPHLTAPGESKPPKIDDIYIDTGYTTEQARERIQPGDVVTISAQARELTGGIVAGRALDNRAGCAAVIRTAQLLAEMDLDCGLTAALSVMEEAGCAGAGTAAYDVNPTHAVVVDVSFAHAPDTPKERCGVMKKGPMIGYAPALSQEISRKFKELAISQGIPYQVEAMGGRTGTNSEHITFSRAGVSTGLLSIPLRYMHSAVELVAAQDVEDTARLIAAYVADAGGSTPQGKGGMRA